MSLDQTVRVCTPSRCLRDVFTSLGLSFGAVKWDAVTCLTELCALSPWQQSSPSGQRSLVPGASLPVRQPVPMAGPTVSAQG